MDIVRISHSDCGSPFPLYHDLVDLLRHGHGTEPSDSNATVAHVLATCSGYAYSDATTVATMMARLGLVDNACVQISQTVDAMLIFSTACIVQSRCGRVVVLCYRGTEPGSLGNWLGDAEVGSESSAISSDGRDPVRVHAGFHLNLRATWLGVIENLELALEGRSLAAPAQNVANRLETLYVAGHSLGGAMATLFALSIIGTRAHRAIADRLRAVYTFGQPMAVCGPLPRWTNAIGEKLFRYVTPRDLIPALPAASWGPFTHLGHEYRYTLGAWQRADGHVAQLTSVKEIPRAVVALFARERRRDAYKYSLGEHAPHHYIAALRPPGMLTEFGI